MKYLILMVAMAVAVVTYGQDNIYEQKWWNGQKQDVEKFEGEFFGAINTPFTDANFTDPKAGWGIGAELRYNFSKIPIDAGLQLGHITTIGNCYDRWIDHHNLNFIAATGDWNFAQGEKLNPFAGASIGIGWVDDNRYCFANSPTIVVIPRIGLEYARLLRLTLSTPISQEGYNCMQLSLGLVVGGKNSLINKESGYPGGKTPEYYLRQSRRSKGFAWGLLGIGVPLMAMGTAVVVGSDDFVGVFMGITFIATGSVMSIGSIPLFITSHNQKKKAAELSISPTSLSLTF